MGRAKLLGQLHWKWYIISVLCYAMVYIVNNCMCLLKGSKEEMEHMLFETTQDKVGSPSPSPPTSPPAKKVCM